MKQVNEKRISEKVVAFRRFGDTGNGGITRLSLSSEALEARKEFQRRMEAIGAKVVTDDLANMYATIPGTEDIPAILSGSHLDSVRQGGNYDGVLGVLCAMEMAETIVKEKIIHRHPITVVVWTNEEGARFEPAMMSSGIICGKFDEKKMMASPAVDIPGYTFGQALRESGFQGSRENRMNPDRCKALIELHAEQGPVLDAEGIDIGIVEGVVGMVNYEFTFLGQADHAGTTPMTYRQDALYAAAQGIMYLHKELDQLDPELVYTTGKISACPNIHTVIPEKVCFTLDARHKSMEVLSQVENIVHNIPKEIAGCKTSYQLAWKRSSVKFAEELVQHVEDSAMCLGYSCKKMYSGAGHDAQYMSDVLPTTMIFVPSDKGHSHCELEFTPDENCFKGANVLLNTVLAIDKMD